MARGRYIAQDALSYGATGAGIGSTFGPVGTAVGGGIGLVVGGVSGWMRGDEAAEQEELAEALTRGEVDPEYRAYLERTLGNRYQALRGDLGNQLARRGLADSSFAGRAMVQTYASEQQSLANALTQASMQRMGLGYDVMAQRNADQAALGQGIAETVGQIANYNLARQGLELEHQRIGQTQYRTPAGPPASGKMAYPYYPRFATQGQRPSPNAHRPFGLPEGRGALDANKPIPYQGPTRPTRSPSTGSSGMGQLRKPGAAPVKY